MTEIFKDVTTRIRKLIAGSREARVAAFGQRAMALTLLATVAFSLMAVAVANTKFVTVIDGDNVTVVRSFKDDIGEILEDNHFQVGPNDRVDLKEETSLLAKVEIVRAFPVTVSADGNTYTDYVTEGTVEQMLQKHDIQVGEYDALSAGPKTPVYDGMNISVNRVTYETVTKNELIPYDTVRTPSQNIPNGKTVLVRSGKAGVVQTVLKNTYVDGTLVGTEPVSKEVVSQPVNAEVQYGTGGELTSRGTPVRYSYYVDMTATAYTFGDGGSTNTTASGKKARVGLVAVDTSVIPMGTKLYIAYPNGSYCYGYAVAADTGGGIKGNRIDLFFNTRSECLNFGRRTVRVYVVE